MLYQDIPRIYTAIAEWGACLVYLYMLKREKMKSAHFLIGVLLMLALQCAFLVATVSASLFTGEIASDVDCQCDNSGKNQHFLFITAFQSSSFFIQSGLQDPLLLSRFH